MLYITAYYGPFGFIKPWTAVRDEETFSQQFLTPATLRGIEQRLFPELLEYYEPKIRRYRLRYLGISIQKERTQPKAFSLDKVEGQKVWVRPRSIINRGILVEPELLLAFSNESDAQRAIENHICLCRNEDVLLPKPDIIAMSETDFDQVIAGFELLPSDSIAGFLVGFNRFMEGQPMYGQLLTVGNPLQIER